MYLEEEYLKKIEIDGEEVTLLNRGYQRRLLTNIYDELSELRCFETIYKKYSLVRKIKEYKELKKCRNRKKLLLLQSKELKSYKTYNNTYIDYLSETYDPVISELAREKGISVPEFLNEKDERKIELFPIKKGNSEQRILLERIKQYILSNPDDENIQLLIDYIDYSNQSDNTKNKVIELKNR